MPRTTFGGLLVIAVAAAAAAGCTSDRAAGPDGPWFMTASIMGAFDQDYVGTGVFNRLTNPDGSVQYSLFSRGSGVSAGQGFQFSASDTPAPGEYPIMATGPRFFQYVGYWYDIDDVRSTFLAQSGTVRITESTSRRIAGTFQFDATLDKTCLIQPGFPTPILLCEPAEEQVNIQVTGSFEAGPLGGDSPGLVPHPG